MRRIARLSVVLHILAIYSLAANAAGEINWGLLDPNAPAKAANSFYEGQERARRQQVQELQIKQLQLENARREAALRSSQEQRTQSQPSKDSDASGSFINNPNGSNLLRLIEVFQKEKNQPQSQLNGFFLLGFFVGIEQAAGVVNYTAFTTAQGAKPSFDKVSAGKKLAKDDELALATVRGASIVAPLGMLKVPAEASWEQKISVVEKYLKERPEKLHLPAYELAVEALSLAFGQAQ